MEKKPVLHFWGVFPRAACAGVPPRLALGVRTSLGVCVMNLSANPGAVTAAAARSAIGTLSARFTPTFACTTVWFFTQTTKQSGSAKLQFQLQMIANLNHVEKNCNTISSRPEGTSEFSCTTTSPSTRKISCSEAVCSGYGTGN
ncbi:unnamed protein product [Calypogeia fissa]